MTIHGYSLHDFILMLEIAVTAGVVSGMLLEWWRNK